LNYQNATIPSSPLVTPLRAAGGGEGFFFKNDAKPLFGCYLPAQRRTARKCGVVLCYPVGHEYGICHRAFRQLAQRLAVDGFPTLRFDYYGSGDSAGDCREGGIAQWVSDTCSAVRTLRAKVGVDSVYLVGCRLGASLALRAAPALEGIAGTALWHPITSGSVWLKELEAEHRRMLLHAHVARREAAPGDDQILGFPVTQAMRAELEAMDLLAYCTAPGQRILLIESEAREATCLLRKHLEAAGADVTERQALGTMPWTWSENPTKLLVPAEIIQSIVAWLKGASA